MRLLGQGPGGQPVLIRAKAEGGEALFAGQVGIRSGQATGRTWGGKDRTPVMCFTGVCREPAARPAVAAGRGVPRPRACFGGRGSTVVPSLTLRVVLSSC